MSDAGGQRLPLREFECLENVPLDPGQCQALRTHFGRYLDIRPAWQIGCADLVARDYVGTIVVDDLSITIEPKVPLDNLFFMLSYAYDLPEFRREWLPTGETEDLFEFLAVIFARLVLALGRRGLFRDYVGVEDDFSFLRGQLQLAAHLRRNAAHAGRFYQRLDEFTADTIENRILKYTLWLLSWQDFRHGVSRRIVRQAFAALTEARLQPPRPEDCDRVVFTRLNEGYRNPIHLARVLLERMSVESRAGTRRFIAFLFPMAQVFQDFIARYLQEQLASQRGTKVHIQRQISLADDGPEPGFLDVLVEREGKPPYVLDTKYKRYQDSPSEADRNQMLVYCRAAGASGAMLLYPAPDLSAALGPDRIRYRRTFQGIRLTARLLPLSGPLGEFREEYRQFAAALTGGPELLVTS